MVYTRINLLLFVFVCQQIEIKESEILMFYDDLRLILGICFYVFDPIFYPSDARVMLF